MKSSEDIIKEIESFKATGGNWLELDELIEDLFESNNPEKGIVTLFNIFERFPEEDGESVLWSIVHGLENLNIYEKELVESLQRQPSHLGVVMLRRIENTGQKDIAGEKIDEIYNQLLSHTKLPITVREEIEEYQKLGPIIN